MSPLKNTSEEFSIISDLNLGYRSREDNTNLPPGVLIKGSQNVLTKATGRIGIRGGYTLDGDASTVLAPILSSFDWKMHTGYERNLRAGFLTTELDDGKLQYRYKPSKDPIDTGLRFPTAVPANVWTDPANAYDDDADFATCTTAGLIQRYTTFGLGVGGTRKIPLPSKIYGIEVQVSCKSDAADSQIGIRLSYDGGTNWTSPYKVGTPAITTATTLTFGGAGDLWGYNWQDIDLDDNYFQLGILGADLGSGSVISVQYIKVVIYYKYEVEADPTWRDLMEDLTSVDFNFADYWDDAALQSKLLFVNGGLGINEWTGGITTIAQLTANTIEKQGEKTWAEEGFYATGTHIVIIDGTEYTATGGWATKILTGVSPSPAAEDYGDVVHQKPETTLNSAMTGIPTAFKNDLIAVLHNQIYIGSKSSRFVYISEVGDYKVYTFTATRLVGEGALITLDGNCSAFIPQEDSMYISNDTDQWYKTIFTLSSDLTAESLSIIPLLTAVKQGAKSQALVTKSANDVVYLSNEPIINLLGRVEGTDQVPRITDISFPIENDMNNYDWTDASLRFFKNFLYVAVPRESKVLLYNMTNLKNMYWEAPQIIPISRFSIIDGGLYGHSYLTPETYKLFDGYNDNGNQYEAIAKISYNNHGSRVDPKVFDEYFVEGYISSNTKLNLDIDYDIDGCMTETSREIIGSDKAIVCVGSDDNSLGKKSLGKAPLGNNENPQSGLPPKFRVIKTFTPVNFYEQSTSFRSQGIDYQWEILAFGPNVKFSEEGNNSIKQ